MSTKRYISKFRFALYVIDKDECSPNPCQNDGSCFDEVDNYTCECAAGFTGTDCETGNYFLKNPTALISLQNMY